MTELLSVNHADAAGRTTPHSVSQPAVRAAVLLLLLTALILAVAGQRLFRTQPETQWDAGIAYYLLAIGAFALAGYLADRGLGRVRHDPPLPAHCAEARPDYRATLRRALNGRRWRLTALAAVLAVFVLDQLGQPDRSDYTLTFWVWIAAIGLYVAALIRRPVLPPDWRSRLIAQRRLIAVVALIFAAALLLRGWDVGGIPPTVSGDEGSQGVEALKFLSGELRNPFVTSWLSVPTMSFAFNALTIGLLGHTATALRLPWVMVGAMTVPIVFVLVRRLKGTGFALMTAALLAAYHYHIHFSRLGSNQIADALFMAAAFWFLYRAYSQGRAVDWALAGVVAGLAQYFYAGARFTTVMAGVTVAWFVLREGRRFWNAQWTGIAIGVGAFLITAGPMLQYAARFPDDYDARLNSVGVFQSGWLLREQGVRHQGVVPILLDQFKRAALSYSAYPDRVSWYGGQQPFFDGPWAVLFMLGLGYATLRPLDRRHFPMLLWWWGGIILGGMLTESPPSSQRLITTAPPAVFFVVLGAYQAASLAATSLRLERLRRAAPALAAAGVVGLSALSINYYFAEYTPTLVYGNPTAVVAMGIVRYAQAQQLGPGDELIFFGPPRMYINFGSIAYLAPDVPGMDVSEPLTAPPPADLVPAGKRPVFLFLPERANELDFVKQTFPDGDTTVIPAPRDGLTLFIAYRVNHAPGG